MISTDDSPTVLVVDEEALAGLADDCLPDGYSVETADGGAGALDAASDAIDVVLIERQLPDVDTVVRKIRRRDYDCRIALVTEVAPDLDILELGIDGYLVRPVGASELRETVGQLLRQAAYDDHLERLGRIRVKLAALEAEKSRAELAANDEYRALEAESERLEAETGVLREGFDDVDFVAAMRSIAPNLT